MVVERGYERQAGVSAPVATPGASAAAFGAGVGAGIAGVADAMHVAERRADEVERQQRADSEAAGAALKLADARLALSKARDDLRNENAANGAPVHYEQSAKLYDDATTGIADGITDARVLRSVKTQMAEQRASFLSGEHAWQVGTAARWTADTIRTTGEKWAALVGNSDDSYAEASKAIDDLIDNSPGMGEYREPVRRELHAKLAVANADRMRRTNPSGLLQAIDGGAYGDVLSEQQLNHLRSGAEIEVHRNEAAQQAEAAVAIREEKRTLAKQRAEWNAGAGSPMDGAQMAARYEALGDDVAATEIRSTATARAATIQFSANSLPQLDQQISALTAKKNRGALSVGEASTLLGLVDLRGQKAGRLGQPGGAMVDLASTAPNRPIPALDMADPSSFVRRSAYALDAAAVAGRAANPEPLTASELPTFKDLVANGGAQRMQALTAIQQFGNAQVVAAAARQVTERDDGAFRIAAQSPPSVARRILSGGETLKTRPAIWDNARAGSDFQKWYGTALGFVGGDAAYRNDVFAGAKPFYAQGAVDAGDDHYTPGRFAAAIETLVGYRPGPNGGTGGFARWGRGRTPVLIPTDMNAHEVEQRFTRSTAADYARAAGGHKPRWADGTGLTRGELATLIPVAVDGAGHYAFRREGSRELLHNETGRDAYVIDIRRLK